MPLLVKSRVQYASILGRDFVGGLAPKGAPKGSSKGGPPKGSSKGGPPKGSSKGGPPKGVIKDYCASRLRWRAGASGHHREGPWGSPRPEAPWPEAPARQRKREAQ